MHGIGHKLICGQVKGFKPLIYGLIREYSLEGHMRPCGIFSKLWCDEGLGIIIHVSTAVENLRGVWGGTLDIVPYIFV